MKERGRKGERRQYHIVDDNGSSVAEINVSLFANFFYRQFNESRAMHTSSPSPYSPSPTRRSLSPSPAMLAPSGSSGVGFTPPSPLRGRTQSFGSAPQGTAHGHHHGHATSTTSLPTRSGILPSHTHATPASLQQVSKSSSTIDSLSLA